MMSGFKLRFLLVCSILAIFAAAQLAEGHWDDSMPYKWVQYPDLTDYNGIDVDATVESGDLGFPRQVLADDFLCTESGELTGIHIWGSWLNDRLPFGDPAQVVFTLSLHTDIPDPDPTDPDNWSMPGNVLWYRTFGPDDFTVNTWATDLKEGWYVPCVTPPVYYPLADTVCWQYNFYLDPGEFIQEGTNDEPIVYWLDVQARPLDPNARFGWKSSQDHWNDDAVWGIGSEPFFGPWNEMRYPFGHRFEQQSIDLAFVITGEGGTHDDIEYGDAPEGTNAVAYPSSGVTGAFPTCMTSGPAGFISHGLGWAHFVFPGGPPAWDPEPDGDAGLCPPPGCFPTYDDDECYLDGDAGLMFPEPYTIDGLGNVVTCPCSVGTALGTVCMGAVWSLDVDIWVVNTMPVVGYVNVLMDWNQDGFWAGVAACPLGGAPEHVLVDFPVPIGYNGPLSGLGPPGFRIGPNSGYVWSRFSITNVPILNPDWDGSGSFEDGETEDYLLRVDRVTTQDIDFGDAPDPNYPTLLANDGARHVIGGPYFCDPMGGDAPDPEPDGLPHPWAIGDDIDADGDDEDGVTFPVMTIGVPATISLNVCGAPAVGAWVQIWIDFNHDEDWDDAGEQVYNANLTDGAYLVTVTAPAGSATGITFARCRISTGGGLLPTGQASDGEVEDHRVEILPAPGLKPATPHLKWSQPPIEIDPNIWPPVYCGWDEPSWTSDPNEVFSFYTAADDFRCLGTMPITSIHWWGSHVGWQDVDPPMFAPITGWLIRFFANVPATPGTDPNYSHPAQLLWEVQVDESRVTWEWVGYDDFPDRWPDTCFQYNVDLEPEEWFWQDSFLKRTTQDVFWISIKAIYPPGADPIYPWGWKTRPWHWMDDAVRYECRLVGGIPPVFLCRMWPIKDSIWGESYDLAFELDTDPNYIKWEQPYDSIHHWPHYEDEKSMAQVYRYTETKWPQYPDLEPTVSIDVDATADLAGMWPPQVIADDFECIDPDPITDIHLWTSWFNDTLPFGDPNNVIFTLSIHDDIPKGAADDYSMPGDLRWWRQFGPGDFQSSIWATHLDE
ncbi:MAG: DUF7901 domain-containing protein, partial [Planctomycetota bacterium]